MTDNPPAAPSTRLRRAGTGLARFGRAEQGATAVEFGILALPFLLIIFAILEIGMVLWTSEVLDNAVASAARKIYTGEFQSDSTNANKTSAQMQSAFKANMCAAVTALFDCESDVSVDVRNAASFGGATPPSPVANGAYDTSGYGYQSIGPKQIAVVTASLEFKSLMPFATTTTSLSNGNRLIVATAVFITEPYSN